MNEKYGAFGFHKHTSVFNDGFKIGGFELSILKNLQKTTGIILALRSVPVSTGEKLYSRRLEVFQLPKSDRSHVVL